MAGSNEELRARPLGQQPRESECTAEAARYFHDEGWNAAIAALAPAQEPAGGATPTPQAESLAAGRNEPAPGTTLRFGMGAFIVNTGAHAGEPAVFVDAAQEPGAVGEAAPTIPAGTTPLLRLLFPTKEQAQLVADALVNVTAAGAAPEGWRVLPFTGSFKRRKERWEVYDAAGNGGVVDEDDVPYHVRGLLDALSAAPQPGAQHGQEGRDG